MTDQDDRLAAIGATAASLLRHTPYHALRAQDVAAAIRLRGQPGRSVVWLYNETRSRRVLVALAASHAWREYVGEEYGGEPVSSADSVTGARERVTAALSVITRFHRAERHLMTQVGLGIGDISTTEKRQLTAKTEAEPPTWPDSDWGRIADAAWRGRVSVFASFLAPVLRECAEVITWLPDEVLAEAANRLSDISFHACLTDDDGPVELVARGLAALWFERDLGQVTGGLARDLESCETALSVATRRSTDPRAEASASTAVVRVLLEAGTLHARCAREAARTVALWQKVPDPVRQDTERLSDAASHLGLAASRYGNLGSADDAWRLSRTIADRELNGDVSRIARVDSNLAELAAQTGQHGDAWTAIRAVCGVRESVLRGHPGDAAAWRRMTVSARVRADIARMTGRVTEAVQLSRELLADREARLRDAGHPDVAEATLTLGKAELSAGRPDAARRQLETAAQYRAIWYLPSSLRVQEDAVWLAKATLASGQAVAAIDVLTGQPVLTGWFAERVSFRLGYTARRLAATAMAVLGDAAAAEKELLADLSRLDRFPLLDGLDPLAADLRRSLGEVAMARGHFADAASVLRELADDEATAGHPAPARGWTLVLLARAEDGLNNRRQASACYQSVADLVTSGIDPVHPVVLAARLDEATRRARETDVTGAAKLLAPLLGRHAFPWQSVLEANHPTLASAHALARHLGITPDAPDRPSYSDLPPLDAGI